jgi:hypothetical protein
MSELVEYRTEHGVYYVTPEDAALLSNDLAFGTCVIKTELIGDRVIGTRVDPANIFADVLDEQIARDEDH